MHKSIFSYGGGRYFWIAMVLVVASIAAYIWHQPPGPPNGGTWLGYVLGTIGALLILWLMLLGIRKRSYSSTMGTVPGWTSAHVYLGTAVLVVATLHAAWQVGWNVHTLAYALMLLVIFSGFFGIYAYMRYPGLMTDLRGSMTREQMFLQVEDLDRQCVRTADKIDPETRALVQSAAERAAVGGGWWRQLTAGDSSKVIVPLSFGEGQAESLQDNSDQKRVIELVAKRMAETRGGGEVAELQNLLNTLATKQALLRRIRADIRIHAILQIWLYVHVPLSFGLLAALITHVISVFVYW